MTLTANLTQQETKLGALLEPPIEDASAKRSPPASRFFTAHEESCCNNENALPHFRQSLVREAILHHCQSGGAKLQDPNKVAGRD